MVWRSLPGTEIPDYEENTNLVLSSYSGIFLLYLYNSLFGGQNELFSIAKN